MNFLEAIELLKANKSITRQEWKGQGIVLSSIEDMTLKFCLPESMSENMRMNDWMECEPLQYFDFVDATKALLNGKAIKRPKWAKWLSIKKSSHSESLLFVESYDIRRIKESQLTEFYHKLHVDDLTAKDWIIIHVE